eukprot:693380-Hanusia_phi.AAC.2
MRRHLIYEISRHVSDFTFVLRENILAEYEYSPLLSPVQYAELQEEIWCHNFYLRNLCNTDLFPNWPIHEPFEILRSIIERWSEQTTQGSTSSTMTSDLAFKKLGLEKTDDAQEVRSAYRRLAVQLHPDKNPNGRAEFEEVQSAYEFLSKEYLDSDSQDCYLSRSKETLLLLRAQSILFRRCGASLSLYRYPCYQSLCRLIEKEMSRGNHEILCAAFEIIALSTSVDRGNAHEYVLSGGYLLLKESLWKLSSELEGSTKREDLRLRACAFICQALSAIVDQEDSKSEILLSDFSSEARVSLLQCMEHTLELDQSPALITATLYFCLNICKFKDAVKDLLSRGVLWNFLRLLLTYEVGAGIARQYLEQDFERFELYTKMPPLLYDEQVASIQNWQSIVTLWLLSKWSNVLEEDGSLTYASLQLRESLNACLTPSIGSRVIFLCEEIEMEASHKSLSRSQALDCATQKAADILIIIATKSESPSCLWNMQMRTRLQSYITSRRRDISQSSIQDLMYENLQNEIYIAETYLRLLAQSACEDVEDRHKLCYCIFRFILSHHHHNDEIEVLLRDAREHVSLMLADAWRDDVSCSVSESDFHGRVSMQYRYKQEQFDGDLILALDAIRIILAHEHQLLFDTKGINIRFPPCAAQCLQWIPLLLSVTTMSIKACKCISLIFLDLARMYKTQLACSLRSPDLMDFFMIVGRTCDGLMTELIGCLQELLSDGDFLEEFRSRGGVIDLLAWSLSGDEEHLTRGLSTLACAMKESLYGPRVRKDVSRWFPPALLRGLSSSPADCIALLRSTTRSAEFIWNKNCLDELQAGVCRAHTELKKSGNCKELHDKLKIEYSAYDDLMIVGDIFIDIFVKDPMAKLSNPTGFLDALVSAILTLIEQPVEEMETFDESGLLTKFGRNDRQALDRIAEALFTLLRIRSTLTAHLSRSGSLQKIQRSFQLFTSTTTRSEMILLKIFRIASDNAECVEALIASQGVKLILDFIRDRTSLRLVPALDILRACLAHEDTSISRHLIDLGALKILLDLLEESPAGIHDYAVARVHAIEMIKQLERDPSRGSVIRSLLESCQVWQSCKNQKHDLFISTQSHNLLQIAAAKDSNSSPDEIDSSVL